jgi:small-conductance mechanosensitive channel
MKEILMENIIPWILSSGLEIVIIAVAAFLFVKVSGKPIEKVIRKAIPPQHFLTREAERKREDTLIKVFSGVVKVLIYLVAMFMILSEFHIDITPLLAGAGIAGVAFGFGAQYLVRDIITGFFLILENQFRVGDVIKVAGVSGVVEDLTIRVTTLRDMDGIVHNIPNGEMKVVSNLSKDFSRVNLVIGISYSDDINKAIEVINQVGQDMIEDELWKDKLNDAPSFLRVDKLNDSSVDLKIVGETKPLEQWAVTGELRKRIKEAFDQNKIEIPFPQRVMIQKK